MRGWVVCAVGVIVAVSAGGAARGAAELASRGPSVVAPDRAEEIDDAVDLAGRPVASSTTTSTSSTTTSTSTTTTSPPVLPPCDGEDRAAEGDPLDDWDTVVVDPTRSISPDYEPPDLVEVDPPGVAGEVRLRELVVNDLLALLDAVESDGAALTLVSGYRSYDRQETVFAEEVSESGEEAAAATTAVPGHSEHQLGTTVDVLTPGMSELSPAFGETPAGRWVARNAHRFGFVLSYPEGSREESCYSYEPWHLRYVGRATARAIHAAGATPRAWLLAR